MMKTIFFSLLFTFTAHGAIYGTNDLRPAISESVALFAPNNYITVSQNKIAIKMDSLSENNFVCEEVPWAKMQSLPIACTGFLIAPDIMLTAGHCMVNFGTVKNTRTPQCEAFSFVFDVPVGAALGKDLELPLSSRVECETVIEAHHDSKERSDGKIDFSHDWALVKLKTPQKRKTLKLSEKFLRPQDKLSFMGHPMGMGLFKGTGKVLDLVGSLYYRTNLDAFPGHSGSPVMNEKNEVVGILVRGYPESLIDSKTQNCFDLNHCSENAESCVQNDPHQVAGDHVQLITPNIMKYTK